MSRQSSASHFHKSKTLNDKYLLGDEIGKGAYGRVHKGLDLENGDFVAIKQVSLENIPPEDLASIMQEIDLLKNLNHQNIVKYQGSFKTKTHLYIILEYVENGSLANMVKPNKFGALRESVVAVYIAQVLEGLVYLHEQGVIHRDIKGANILTTKEGVVKLADFGVATKLTEADVNTRSVVGTPYWMAPEVIEMSGVSAASDIWSVGCTVIELLTSVPPYYDLQPMPALFRIVQDDHPPLPESIVSAAVTDFLHQCFKKDAKLRPDARTLLKHPWIRNTKRFVPSSLQRTGGRINNRPQDASTVIESPIEDGEKEDRRSVLEEASVTRDPFESGSDDEQKTASSSQSFETSAPNSSQSNSIGRRARIKIPRNITSMQRLAVSNGSGQPSPSSVMHQFASLSVDRLSSNGNAAVDGTLSTLRSSSNVPGSPDLPGLSERFVGDMESEALDEAETFDVREIKIGRGGFTFSQEASVSASTYSEGEDEEVNGTVEGYGQGLKQRASRLVKSQPNGSHHPLQRFENKEESREYVAKQAMEITRLVSLLKPDESEEAVISACQKLVAIFEEYPEQKAHLISQHGIIPLVEMLDVNNNRVLYSVLQLLNQVIRDNADFQENACLVGLIPIIMNLSAAERSREIRLQAAVFVQQICITSSLTLQMFIACRGLPVLVSFLEPDYTTYREMVHVAIDAMWQVFELQNTTTRNDFCRIFSKSGVLVCLVNTLYSLNEATRAQKVLLRSRSGPLEHPRTMHTMHVEGAKARSCQLDPVRVRAGYMEPHRQVTGLIESFRPKSPQAHKSAGLPDYLRVLDQGRGSTVSAEPARMGINLEGGHEIPWQSPGRSFQFSVDRDVASGQTDSPRLDVEQGRALPGSSETSRAPFTEQVWQSTRVANGFVEAGHHDVQPLLSLLEKEPPSRPRQSEFYRNAYSGSIERPDSLLPLLHHTTAIRKVNGKLDAAGAGYAGMQFLSMASPTQSAPMSPHGVGSSSSYNDAPPSSSKNVSQQNSGSHLSTSGALNSKAADGSSPGMVSTMVSNPDAEVSRDYVARVADLLLEFSRADTVVKSHMCSVNLLIRLFHLLSRLDPVILLKILKCIKELSTDPFTLEFLQRAEAMKHLVPFLDMREGPYVSQIHKQVLNALYNLCKINKRRQEQAAESGIIPRLMYFIKENSPLKQFALPLLCDMAHASRYTREQLRAHKGLEVYLNLLNDEYWAVTALDSLAVCLAHDNDQRKVEQALLKKDALEKLVVFFQSCSGPSFVHILEPFLKIITKSVRMNTELAVSGLTPLLVGRLDHQDAIARLNLLKLIKAVYEHHPRPKQLIVEHDLPLKLRKLIEERRDGERCGGQVLVKQMATALLKALHINTVL